ncbi:hypothetical protein Tco_1380282 [Tanacetum coccineum]
MPLINTGSVTRIWLNWYFLSAFPRDHPLPSLVVGVLALWFANFDKEGREGALAFNSEQNVPSATQGLFLSEWESCSNSLEKPASLCLWLYSSSNDSFLHLPPPLIDRDQMGITEPRHQMPYNAAASKPSQRDAPWLDDQDIGEYHI